MSHYIEKEKVVELLKKFGHRVIDVKDSHDDRGSIIIIEKESEEYLPYLDEAYFQ